MDDVPHVDRFLAAAQRAQGNADEARRLAVTLPPDRDEKYDLEFVALAADALAAAGSTDAARDCYARLLPFAGTNVLVGGCASFWGPVDLYLGELAAGLGERVVRHRTPDERGIDGRRARRATSGLPTHWDGVRRWRPPLLRCTSSRRVMCGGSAWDGTTAHVPDSKGVRDLAVLVAHPGVAVPATELAGRRPFSGADPVLDDRAKAEYRRRLVELDEELDSGRAVAGRRRAARSGPRTRRQALLAELSGAVGLGGRDRRLGDDAERARKAVSARIRDAIGRVASVHPALGTHLGAAVRTGLWCSYAPRSVAGE